MCQATEVDDAYVPFAAFYLADISPVKLGFECQPLLRDAAPFLERAFLIEQNPKKAPEFALTLTPTSFIIVYCALLRAASEID